jgi:prolyl oligopeptidase
MRTISSGGVLGLVLGLGLSACSLWGGATPAPGPPSAAPVTGGEWPQTRRDDVLDVIHGTPVTDPYRWLERADDPAVQTWMGTQDDLARRNLGSLPGGDALRRRLRQLVYSDSIGAPARRRNRLFYTRTQPDTEKAVLYRREGDKGAEMVVIDPNTLSPDGSVSLRDWSPSRDGRFLAYTLSKNNADAATLYVRDVDAGRDLGPDVIPGAKYASASWTPDGRGFYYTGLPTDPGIPVDVLPGRAEIRFHVIGSDPGSDPVIHPALGDPTTFVQAGVSRDGRWLLYTVSHGESRTDVWFKDLKAEPAGFRLLTSGQDAIYYVQAWKDRFYVETSEGAPRYRLFRVDPWKLDRPAWEEIVPEREATLSETRIIGGRLVLVYLRKAVNEIEVRDLYGKQARTLKLPGIGAVSEVTGQPDEEHIYLNFESFTERSQILVATVESEATDVWATTRPRVDLSGMVSEQVWYTSKDGTRVSMFLVHRRQLRRNGDNPVLLYGYGGFNVSLENGQQILPVDGHEPPG